MGQSLMGQSWIHSSDVLISNSTERCWCTKFRDRDTDFGVIWSSADGEILGACAGDDGRSSSDAIVISDVLGSGTLLLGDHRFQTRRRCQWGRWHWICRRTWETGGTWQAKTGQDIEPIWILEQSWCIKNLNKSGYRTYLNIRTIIK